MKRLGTREADRAEEAGQHGAPPAADLGAQVSHRREFFESLKILSLHTSGVRSGTLCECAWRSRMGSFDRVGCARAGDRRVP